MASRKDYVKMSELIGRFLMPIGMAELGEPEEAELLQVRRGILELFISGLADWYEQDNPAFSRDLFQKAITDQAEASMTKFEAWCERNGGIEYLDKLIQEGKDLPPD